MSHQWVHRRRRVPPQVPQDYVGPEGLQGPDFHGPAPNLARNLAVVLVCQEGRQGGPGQGIIGHNKYAQAVHIFNWGVY